MLDLPAVFDDCVDDGYADLLLSYVKGLSFLYVENVNRVKLSEPPAAPVLRDIDRDIGAFVSGIYCHGEKTPDVFLPLIEQTATRLGIAVDLRHLIRIKANILPPLITKTANRLNLPHIDANIPHLVFLYYLNDCDGDTVFFNKQWRAGMSNSAAAAMADLRIGASVAPKKNRMLVFDGSWFHASSVPTRDYRLVVNINISYPGVISDYADPASWGARLA